jgi:hypothetical protein
MRSWRHVQEGQPHQTGRRVEQRMPYITRHTSHVTRHTSHCAGMCSCVAWSSTSDTLAAVTDDKVPPLSSITTALCVRAFMFAWHVVMRVQVIVWNYPDVVLVDKDMIDATTTGAVPRIPRGKSQLTDPSLPAPPPPPPPPPPPLPRASDPQQRAWPWRVD